MTEDTSGHITPENNQALEEPPDEESLIREEPPAQLPPVSFPYDDRPPNDA